MPFQTTTELATMCKHKPKTQFSGFAGVCGFLRAFRGFLRDVCGAFWSLFFFWQILCKSALHRKSKRGYGVRPAYPTPMHYSGNLKNCYLHARETGGKYYETFKTIQFPWFLGVSIFDDDPQKTRRFQPLLVNNQKGQNILGV